MDQKYGFIERLAEHYANGFIYYVKANKTSEVRFPIGIRGIGIIKWR